MRNRNSLPQAVLALALIALGISLLVPSALAAPPEQLCSLPFTCVVPLAGPPQASIGTAPTIRGNGFAAREPVFFFLNCDGLGQVAIYNAILTDRQGRFVVGLGISNTAAGACQIGALGLSSGTLGVLPIFIFGSGIITFPTATPVPPPPAQAPPPAPTAPASVAPTPRPTGRAPGEAAAGGAAALLGGFGVLAMVAVRRRRPDR